MHSASNNAVSTTTVVPTIWNQMEVAEYLGVSHQTLERWRYVGEGPAYLKAGRSVRYRAADVVAFLDAGRVETR